MKILLTLLLVVPTFAQIETKYDKFKDATVVSYNTHIGFGTVYVFYSYAGQSPSKEANYYVMFSYPCSRQCTRTKEATFLIDNSRLVLDGSYSLDTSRTGLREKGVFAVSQSDLERLVSASKVEFRWGRTEGELGDRQRKGIKELLGNK